MAHSTTMEFLEGYEPVRVLGAGAFGIVFEATRTLVDEEGQPVVDEQTGNQLTEVVAIKKIPDYRCTKRYPGIDFKERFLKRVCREIDILMHFCECTQVVEIKDLYLSDNGVDLYIVMAFVDISWDKLMRLPEHAELKEAITEKEIKWMMCQLLLGLQALHRSGCMHRDLSLGNILLDKGTFNCFIADFGLSRVQFDAEQDISLDVVSLPYRAPEVLMQCKRYTHTVDVWSAGCVMMELLTKKNFIHAKDALRQLWAIIGYCGFPVLDEWAPISSGTAFKHLKGVHDKSVREDKTHELAKAKDIGKHLQDLTSRGKQVPLCQQGMHEPLTGCIRSFLEDVRPLALTCRFLAEKLRLDSLTPGAGVEPIPLIPGVTDECADVIRAMLVFHPHKRANVDTLLKMPWFVNDGNCKQAIEQSNAQEEFGKCPSEIEGMNYDQLSAHVVENLSVGTRIAGATVLSA